MFISANYQLLITHLSHLPEQRCGSKSQAYDILGINPPPARVKIPSTKDRKILEKDFSSSAAARPFDLMLSEMPLCP